MSFPTFAAHHAACPEAFPLGRAVPHQRDQAGRLTATAERADSRKEHSAANGPQPKCRMPNAEWRMGNLIFFISNVFRGRFMKTFAEKQEDWG